MSVNIEVLEKYKKNILIETGTYLGGTTKSAIEHGYNKVYTIELQPYLYEEAKKNLSSLIEDGKVVILLGNSNQRLSEIMSEVEESVTILLDAHIDGGNYKPNVTPDNVKWCPLYEELEIIKNHPIKNHTILIDDVRIIGKMGWGTGIYLDILINTIKEINPNYEITFDKGETPEDVLVAYIK